MSTRTTLIFLAALVVAGLVIWQVSAGDDGPSDGNGKERPGGTGSIPDLVKAPDADPGANPPPVDRPPFPGDPETRKQFPPEVIPAYAEALRDARAWLDARDKARAAGNEEAERAARAKWDEAQDRFLKAITEPKPLTIDVTMWLGTQADEEAVLALAETLIRVEHPMYARFLVALVHAPTPVLERLVMLTALRHRNDTALGAVLWSAAEDPEMTLRLHATRELVHWQDDTTVGDQLQELPRVLARNLVHEDVRLRRAAVEVLLERRGELTKGERDALETLREDEDPAVREGALALLRRQ